MKSFKFGDFVQVKKPMYDQLSGCTGFIWINALYISMTAKGHVLLYATEKREEVEGGCEIRKVEYDQ